MIPHENQKTMRRIVNELRRIYRKQMILQKANRLKQHLIRLRRQLRLFFSNQNR